MEYFIQKYGSLKYSRSISLAMMGHEKDEYKEKDSLNFRFLDMAIYTTEPIKNILRDIKLNTIEL